MSVDDDMTVKEAEEKSAGNATAKLPDSEQSEPVAEIAVAEETKENAPANSIVPDPTLCGVCKTGPPKYKCSRCELP